MNSLSLSGCTKREEGAIFERILLPSRGGLAGSRLSGRPIDFLSAFALAKPARFFFHPLSFFSVCFSFLILSFYIYFFFFFSFFFSFCADVSDFCSKIGKEREEGWCKKKNKCPAFVYFKLSTLKFG